jgi:hypothetical protein
MVEDCRGNGTGLKAYGHVVMRVRIDPDTFPDWCAAMVNPALKGAKIRRCGRIREIRRSK